MKLSLAMIVKNEELTIQRCLDSVRHMVDEIIIVDTGSTDRTKEIISKYAEIKLYLYDWDHNFSNARNFAIEQTTGNYILTLDGDEYITKGKKKDLLDIANQNKIGKIKIVSMFESEGEKNESITWTSRFFPRDIRYTGTIHEQLDTELPRLESKITVKHSGYYQTDKTERNISLLLKEIDSNPKDVYYHFQLGKEYRNRKEYGKAFDYFYYAYQNLNPNSGYYPALVTELLNTGKKASLYEQTFVIIKDSEKYLTWHPDFYFAAGLFYLDYSLHHANSHAELAMVTLSKIEHSFKKCIELGETKATMKGTGSYLAHYNLGNYYEVLGYPKQAKEHFKKASKFGYSKATSRL